MERSITERLSELKRDYTEGQRAYADLQARQTVLREQLLRISGAIQVLEEIAQESEGTEAGNVHHLDRGTAQAS